MKVSLIKRIESYAQKNPFWISGGTYEKLSIAAGYKASHADRRCRDLVKAGVLEKKMENGHIWYRYKDEIYAAFHAIDQVRGEEKQKVEAGVQKALV